MILMSAMAVIFSGASILMSAIVVISSGASFCVWLLLSGVLVNGGDDFLDCAFVCNDGCPVGLIFHY